MLHSRSSLCFPFLLVVMVVSACKPSTTDAGMDAGKQTDAGSTDAGGSDAGATDAGPDAGPLTLSIAANPNSVLSAIATVSWTESMNSVSITYDGGETPTTDTSTLTSPATLPVLGLQAATTYLFQADGMDSAGTSVESNEVSFTTGPLPTGVPVFSTTGTQTSGDFTLVARMPLPVPGNDYLTIVDGSGKPVWYYLMPDQLPLGADFQQQPDGTFTIAAAPVAQIPGAVEVICTYSQIDVLGNVIRAWAAADATDTNGNAIKVAATDCHELRIQPDGSALIFGVSEQRQDLTDAGGSADAGVLSTILERVSSDGGVAFAWNATEYTAPPDFDPSCLPNTITGSEVDYTHGNSVDVMDDGTYLVSLRDMSEIKKLDSTTGDVVWTLGGPGISVAGSGGPTGDFSFTGDPLNGFSCQHGVRELPNGDIIMFDDGDGRSPKASRAVVYSLDTSTMTASFVWASTPSTQLYTQILGYAQRFTDGNTLVSYGQKREIQEIEADAGVVWSLTDSQTNDEGTNPPFGFYRAYRLGSLYSYSPP